MRSKELDFQLATAIGEVISDRQMTQTEASHIMRDHASQVSLVVNQKLTGFSTRRLIDMAAALGCDVSVTINKPEGIKIKRGKVKVQVK